VVPIPGTHSPIRVAGNAARSRLTDDELTRLDPVAASSPAIVTRT
jgi:hypothetical protein